MPAKDFNKPPNSVTSKAELDALLLEGLENPLPLGAITKEFWDEIEREVLDSLEGKDIRP